MNVKEKAKIYATISPLKTIKFIKIGFRNTLEEDIKNAYVSGATFILNEIEEILERNEKTFVYSGERYIKTQLFKDKIKQLKEE